jgi:serine protease Do
MKRNSHNFLFSPENDEDMEINAFDNDMEIGGSRTFLGVITEKATDGVKITNVIKGSGAEKAGLQKDDIITQVNDKKIISPEDLMATVRSYKPDDNVKIDYLRNNKKKDVKVKLGETKEKNRAFFYKDGNNTMNGNGFNFKMPRMPKMPNFPNADYNYKFWNKNTPKLGVKIEDTENGSGAKILNVEEGSAADKAGLKKDDIITEINGEKVNNVDEIREQLDEANDKESLSLKAKRNNSEMDFEVKIPKQLNSADL